jgi:pimeloyl-ACP methyl ester carboxylesterase
MTRLHHEILGPEDAPVLLMGSSLGTPLQAGSVEPLADETLGRWLTPEFAATHEEVRWVWTMLVDTPAAGYAACCGAIERMDLRDSLARVQAPTLVMSGDRDPSTPVEQQELIAQAIPAARHEIVAPAAVEQPDAVNQLILEHLS